MPIRDLKGQIARLPEQPGVYLYLNRAGATIYVGRARVLRDRVRSYLWAYGTSPKTDALLDEAAGVEIIVTDSVVEALTLETHLIKQRMPKYNILLRDDKSYPYLQLTTTEDFPRVLVARRVNRDGNFYAGPFLPASFARTTMSLTHRLFGIRSCNEVITGRRGRPCLEYDIKRCVAPCVAAICGPAQYAQAVERTRLFLDGRNDELVTDLKASMAEAAAAERYEEAAQGRDAIRTIESLRNRQQKMATARLGDRDAFGVKVGPAGAVIQVFQMRAGRVVERVELATDGEDHAASGSEADVVRAALQQFYAVRAAPPEVHVPVGVDETDAIEGWLSDRADRRVRVVVPKRGEKRGLLELAARNAALAYTSRFSEAPAPRATLEALRTMLSLAAVPRRVEGFDISTLQGNETVGSMVVCEDGRMKRGEYRKYRIRGLALGARRVRSRVKGRRAALNPPSAVLSPQSSVNAQDDFAAMHEVVLRRYRRLLEEGGPFPDLVVIDGGKGQLSAAYAAFEALGLANLVAIGIAKKEELIFTRDRSDPIALRSDDPALLLIQRIRDEAHRFAVTFHRRARARRDLRSELDDVPGIGPRRRRVLLTRFGSVSNIRRATREELVPVIGPRLANTLLGHFTGTGN